MSYAASTQIPMFSGFNAQMPPSDAELATQALQEEALYRFPSFDADAAVMLGLSIRKRFRASSRHVKVRGMIISIQTIAGHTLFSCTVGNLGGVDGGGDVSLDSWSCLEVGSSAYDCSTLRGLSRGQGDDSGSPQDRTFELLRRERDECDGQNSQAVGYSGRIQDQRRR